MLAEVRRRDHQPLGIGQVIREADAADAVEVGDDVENAVLRSAHRVVHAGDQAGVPLDGRAEDLEPHEPPDAGEDLAVVHEHLHAARQEVPDLLEGRGVQLLGVRPGEAVELLHVGDDAPALVGPAPFLVLVAEGGVLRAEDGRGTGDARVHAGPERHEVVAGPEGELHLQLEREARSRLHPARGPRHLDGLDAEEALLEEHVDAVVQWHPVGLPLAEQGGAQPVEVGVRRPLAIAHRTPPGRTRLHVYHVAAGPV